MTAMGLFDRIRGAEDEVEIRPQEPESFTGRDRERDDSGSDEFILPGMASADTAEEDDHRGSGRSTAEGVDRLIEQNERIIELLEELTGSEDDSSADVESVL